jgi:hypothetical protein
LQHTCLLFPPLHWFTFPLFVGAMLVGTAETAIAMERIETMMDCFILKSWEWEQEFCGFGKR